jgi:hypothetical protein
MYTCVNVLGVRDLGLARYNRDNRGGNEASNPGMNLHVSGLSRDVGADDLNKRFGEVGTVSRRTGFVSFIPLSHTNDLEHFRSRSTRPRSCTTLIPRNLVVSGSS